MKEGGKGWERVGKGEGGWRKVEEEWAEGRKSGGGRKGERGRGRRGKWKREKEMR